VTLKVKTNEYDVLTRAKTTAKWLKTAEDIFEVGVKLLRTELPLQLRLMGIRMSRFKGEKTENIDPKQPSLNDFIGQFEGSEGKSNCGTMVVEEAKCPVCGEVLVVNNDQLNWHIDKCLSFTRGKKKRRIDDFFQKC